MYDDDNNNNYDNNSNNDNNNNNNFFPANFIRSTPVRFHKLIALFSNFNLYHPDNNGL